jgi:hypothetical protein
LRKTVHVSWIIGLFHQRPNNKEDKMSEKTVVVPNKWGIGDEDSFNLPLHPNMSEVFAQTDKSDRYKILFMYLYHPDSSVRLATLTEAKKAGGCIGSHQALVDSLADSSPEVRQAAAQLTWTSSSQLDFTLGCLSEEIHRTAWESTMTSQQAIAALDILRTAAPPDKVTEFEESVAKIIGRQYRH